MVNNIVCRCCLALKPPAPNQWKLLSEAQKYLDLIKQCFNINKVASPNCDLCGKPEDVQHFLVECGRNADKRILLGVNSLDLVTSLKSGICCSCANHVAACIRFRNKVINAEKVFVSTYLPGILKEGKPIKEELDSDGGADAEHSNDNFLAAKANTTVQIKIEDNKEKLRSLKKKSRTETKTQTQKLLRIGQCSVPTKEMKNTPTPVFSQLAKRKKISTDKEKHIHNIETILECSNITIFKKTTLNYYQCFLCESPFEDPAELRTHAEQNHHNKKVNRKWYDVLEQVMKVDITHLKCNLCDDQIANLQLLKLHLQNNHEKNIHEDIKDHIIPFKLTSGDGYNCALCTSTYETFKMLNQHMNTHYSNYKCDKCEVGFAAKRSLTLHQKTHVQGEYKCNLCDNVYSSNMKMQYHMKKSHLRQSYPCKCGYCDAPFKDYYKRNQHMKEVHNIDSQYKCNICDRHFFLKTLLMNHVKKVHLMERNVQCTECGYKFFSKKSLKGHMLKHTGEKNHPCPVCKKAFGRAHTLREHMRIHNNDRRFKCDVCELSFVQKCSLKSHLLSNHGINMPATEISASSTD